jgi:hypothetical protein
MRGRSSGKQKHFAASKTAERPGLNFCAESRLQQFMQSCNKSLLLSDCTGVSRGLSGSVASGYAHPRQKQFAVFGSSQMRNAWQD